ncbi:MAG: hypothetical protein ACXW25_03805 [Rhodospirillales bacterium]
MARAGLDRFAGHWLRELSGGIVTPPLSEEVEAAEDRGDAPALVRPSPQVVADVDGRNTCGHDV